MGIRALYELKRQNFLIGFIQSPDNFDPGLAYAYKHRLAPIFHEAIMRESYGDKDPFAEAYVISADFVDEVTKFIDKCALENRLGDAEFYKLEDQFGGYKSNRMELLHVVEYARISRRFDDQTYAAIEANAPMEANSIDATFEPKDVFFG